MKFVFFAYIISFMTLAHLPLDGQSESYQPTVAHQFRSELYQHCLNICMDIWTDLDLMGAIRTSTEDLMFFAGQLLEKLLDYDHYLKQFRTCHEKEAYAFEELETIVDLTRQIDGRFYDIFEQVHGKEIICCSLLLERSLCLLDTCYVATMPI